MPGRDRWTLVSLADAEARLYHHDPARVRFCLAEVPLAAAGGCWVRRDLGERLQTLLYDFWLIGYVGLLCVVIVVGVSEDKQRMLEAGVEVETHSLRARAATLHPAAREGVCTQ